MAVIEIEVIFDIVCAWCYIGRRTLSKAIQIHQKTYPGGRNDVFKIVWRPYYLNYGWIPHEPDAAAAAAVAAPDDGAAVAEGSSACPPHLTPSMDKAEFAKYKLADLSDDQVARVKQRVAQIGRSVGILFKDGGKVGSTRAAHHLIYLARQKDDKNSNSSSNISTALVEKLFEAYHEREMDISTRGVLRDLAMGEDVGLDPVDVDECLDFCFDSSVNPFESGSRSAAGLSKFASSIAVVGAGVEGEKVESIVDKEARESREQTKTGVPLFIVQGKYRVEGVQDLGEFIEVFGKIREAAE